MLFRSFWTVRYPKGVRRDKGDAANAQPTSSTTRIASFDESGMGDGTTPGL